MIVRGGLVKKWKQVIFYVIVCEIQTRIIETVKPKIELDQNKKLGRQVYGKYMTHFSRCFGRLTMSAALPPVGELGRQQLSLSLICRLELTTDN